ncbi:IS110 family transposase [Clostridium transplantifaecale]|uniref:IS110 family transposase n=1 Tax=Clostridium transplantifaecale TaxID=2479838 RepID=UPI000F634914|nr:IS110 family transposase [Clostridium transplantifaecale]
MHVQKTLPMPKGISYLSVGFDVGADFSWMSIMLPNATLSGKPSKILHTDSISRELAVAKIKEAQELYSLESKCFLESTGIYHIPLLYFLRDKGFDCSVINPIITKNSTNLNIRKLHSDKFDTRKTAKIGLDPSLKTSIVPDDDIIDLRNLARDYYYFKDLQSAVVLKLHAELRVSFPAYLHVFSKITTLTSLKLLAEYPLASDMLAAPKEKIIEMIKGISRFGDAYALSKYDAICAAARDAAVFGRALPSNALRIRLYIQTYLEYQKHLDSLLEELHKAMDKLKGKPAYDRFCLLQSLHGVGFLSAVVLIAEMGDFDLFTSPKKLYAYFGLDPAVKQSGKFHGDNVHMSKRGSSLARRVLHMVAVNNLKMDKGTKSPVNPVIYDYYIRKCVGKKKNVAVGAVMHKICNIIFAMLRDNKPFEIITPQEHCSRYTAEHPASIEGAA